MLKNDLKIAFRNLLKHKGYTFINVTGLAVGMACCFLILLYVQDEMSYDKFHDNAKQIYRVTREFGSSGSVEPAANTSYPIAPAFKVEFPEVVDVVRFRRRFRPVIRYKDKRFWEEGFCLTDSTFLDVFTFPMVKGNPGTALREPNSVVLTEETARRYFGDEDPMGKVLLYNHDIEFKVTGVLRNLPQNTHFKFDFIAPIESLDGPWERWTTFVRNYTYLVLTEGYDPAELESKFPALIDKYVGKELSARGYTFKLHLQRLTDIHLRSHLSSEIKPNSDIAYVYLFSAIAFFILLIACINFMNLSTARSARRAKEVGLRKVIGAHRLQIIQQFLGESIILSLIAFLLAIGSVELLLPGFNALSGKELVFHGFDTLLLLGLIGIVLFVGIVAGGYPAFFLSAFQPVEVLKGGFISDSAGSRVRKSLVIFQFIISIALIVCPVIVYKQMDYIRKKDLGFDKEQIIVVPLGSQVRQRSEVIKSQWKQHPYVLNATSSLLVPTRSLWTWNVIPQGKQKAIETGTYMVDYDFIETYKMEIITGRNFAREFAMDAKEAFLINETAMLQFGWASPEIAIGKQLDWAGERKGNVIGVVRDFHVGSLHEKIDPVVFFINPDYNYLSVRILADDIGGTISYLENTWSEYLSHLPFEYFFLDERFDQLHRADKKVGAIFGSFSTLAVIIACLGLFGLASFTAEQRTKEIGIRKVLGATVANVTSLLSKDFIKLVLVANLIAWPVAWYAMNRWLQGFAYRIDVGWLPFALAGGLALIIALLTVSTQAIKAALANPVKSLRYE